MKRGRWITGLGVVGIVVLLLLAATGSASALEQRIGQTVEIGPDEVINGDLLVSAENFVLNGTVKGDVIVAGGALTIGSTGRVEGDLIAAGRSIDVQGAVRDHAFVAGAALKVGSNASIGDDLIGAAASLETASGGKIGDNLFFVGAQALLGGDVTGSVLAGVGGLDLQGKVDGDVKASVGAQGNAMQFSPFAYMPNMPAVPTVPNGLTVGPEASIGGSLTYTAPQQASIPPGVVQGQVNYTQTAPKPERAAPQRRPVGLPAFGLLAGVWLLGLVRNTATWLIVGLLLAWLAPKLLRAGSELLRTKPWPSLAWGLVAFFGVWVAAFVIVFAAGLLALLLAVITLFKLAALVFVVGLLLASALVVAYVIAAGLLAKIIVGYLIGRLILRRLDPAAGRAGWPLVLGIVILAIVISIPCLGLLVSIAATLFGLGALWLFVRELLQRPRAEAA